MNRDAILFELYKDSLEQRFHNFTEELSMNFAGQNVVIAIAYTIPILFFSWRLLLNYLKEGQALRALEAKKSSVRSDFTEEQMLTHRTEVSDAKNKFNNLRKKSFRILFYIVIFGILFFWRPIKFENNPHLVEQVRASYINGPYKTDDTWTPRTKTKSLEQLQSENLENWQEVQKNLYKQNNLTLQQKDQQ